MHRNSILIVISLLVFGFFLGCDKEDSIDTFINVRLVHLDSEFSEPDSSYLLNFEAFFVDDPLNLELTVGENEVSNLNLSYDRVFYSNSFNPKTATDFSISVEYQGLNNEAQRRLIPLAKKEDLIIETSDDLISFNWRRTDASDKYILHIYDPYRSSNSFDSLWILNSPEISLDKNILPNQENNSYFVVAGSASGLNPNSGSFNIKDEMPSRMIFFSGSNKRIPTLETQMTYQDSLNADSIVKYKLNEMLNRFD